MTSRVKSSGGAGDERQLKNWCDRYDRYDRYDEYDSYDRYER